VFIFIYDKIRTNVLLGGGEMEKAIRKAMEENKKILIIYVDRYGHFSKRMIHIISYKEKKLIAYCYARREIRTFHQDNILAIEQVREQMEV